MTVSHPSFLSSPALLACTPPTLSSSLLVNRGYANQTYSTVHCLQRINHAENLFVFGFALKLSRAYLPDFASLEHLVLLGVAVSPPASPLYITLSRSLSLVDPSFLLTTQSLPNFD